MKVTALNIYPVKSFRGIAVSRSSIDEFGLERDRRWMLVDGEGKFVSQRRHPRMALLQAFLSDAGEVCIAVEGNIYSLIPDPGLQVEVTVWSDTCLAWQNADPTVDDRISSFLGLQVKLVYMPDDTFRQVDRHYFPGDQRVGFTDGYPILLLNEASLRDLNRRLPHEVGMDRFRGNIVVDTDLPYVEDDWKKIQIGEVMLAVVKPCSRCVMTTVDSATGVKGSEPLKTLSGYRKTELGVIFGQNMVQLNAGVISVGDTVRLVE
ncbi:MAG: MOSC domain-containing protein [Hahellaceae bacterium]|nr:MOSC domain-containing protein [Hahellaceae bacterium]MCP5211851.1 MOSC domain-containing protein [Hahellaceae bacterium]